jgi:3-oxoacyl-[acyl-carrier protein] reductase
MSLAGKVALITGGSRGIGAATVRIFRQAGAKVAFSYRVSDQQAQALAAECGGPDLCRAIPQPLSTPEDGQALVTAAVAAFGRLDCVVANHGVWPSHDAPISTMTTTQWRDTLSINLDSVFGLVRAAVAQMQSQPPTSGSDTVSKTRGHIVLVSSTAAQRGEAFHADYAASKGALISLTKSLSSELIG